MHDTQLKELQGWPDLCDTPSVIRCVKRAVTITAPQGLTTSTWDLIISTSPVVHAHGVHHTGFWGNYLLGPTEGIDQIPANFVNYMTFEHLSNATNYSLLSHSWKSFNGMGVPANFCEGIGRLVGAGIEAIDVTADLYKQGTLHCFRQPQSSANDTEVWNVVNGTTVRNSPGTGTVNISQNAAVEVLPIQWVPAYEEDMVILPGSRTWKAEEGCYMVVPFQGIENPASVCEVKHPLYSDEVYALHKIGADGSPQICYTKTYTTTEIGGSSQHLFTAIKTAPVHTSSMAFIGLHPNAAITLTLNAYYEYMPTSAEYDLATLATPSASYDPVALSLYSEALKSLPVGVPASMNGLGDWFAGVVSQFAPALGLALSPAFGPSATAIGGIAKGVADSYMTSNSPMTRPKLAAPKSSSAPGQRQKPQAKKKKKKKVVQAKSRPSKPY